MERLKAPFRRYVQRLVDAELRRVRVRVVSMKPLENRRRKGDEKLERVTILDMSIDDALRLKESIANPWVLEGNMITDLVSPVGGCLRLEVGRKP